MFYDDPHRWAFVFETNALMSLTKLHMQDAKAPVKVMERSIHSARYCFIENLYQRCCRKNISSHLSPIFIFV